MEPESNFAGKSQKVCSSPLRARRARFFISGLIFFGLAVGLGAPASGAEEAATPMAAPAPAQNGQGQGEVHLNRVVAADEVKKRRGKHVQAKKQRDKWWNQSRQTLLAGIDLTPDQDKQITALITAQKQKRTRYSKLDIQLAAARSANDLIRSRELRGQVREARGQIQSLHEVLDSMREVLTEKQRVTFDVNRAKLIAEGQALRASQKKKGAGGKKAPKNASPAEGGGAGGSSETSE